MPHHRGGLLAQFVFVTFDPNAPPLRRALAPVVAEMDDEVGDAPDDGNCDALDADTAIEAVDGANQACCVTRRQLQEILVNAFLVVGVAVKEDVCDLVLLAPLKDRFLAVLYVELLVLGAYAGRGGIEHDIDLR